MIAMLGTLILDPRPMEVIEPVSACQSEAFS